MINVAGGTLRVINTTVTCNTATGQGGSAFNANVALIVGSNLIADTTVPTGRKLFNAPYGSTTATNFNLVSTAIMESPGFSRKQTMLYRPWAYKPRTF
jgi:hypothetical protein